MCFINCCPSGCAACTDARQSCGWTSSSCRAGNPEPLQSGAINLAIAYFPRRLPESVQARRIALLRPTLVLPSRHPLARRPRPDLRACADETFIAYRQGTLQHDLQMKALARHGITPRRLLFASSAEAILGLVAAGIGYSLVPSLANGPPRRPGVVARPFPVAGVRVSVQAVWRRTSPADPAIEAALASAPTALVLGP